MAILKETIDLSNNVLVKIHLLPMPKKVNGEYPKITSEMPEISFTFWNKCESTGEHIKLKKISWLSIIRTDGVVGLKGSHHLSPENVIELNSAAWEILLNYGIYPTSLY